MYAPYSTVCLVISLPIMPYIHCIYIYIWFWPTLLIITHTNLEKARLLYSLRPTPAGTAYRNFEAGIIGKAAPHHDPVCRSDGRLVGRCGCALH